MKLKIILAISILFSFHNSRSQIDNNLFTNWILVSLEKDTNSYTLLNELTVRFKTDELNYYSKFDSIKETDCIGKTTYTRTSIKNEVTACSKQSYLSWPLLYQNPDNPFSGTYIIQGNTLIISNKGLKYNLVKK